MLWCRDMLCRVRVMCEIVGRQEIQACGKNPLRQELCRHLPQIQSLNSHGALRTICPVNRTTHWMMSRLSHKGQAIQMRNESNRGAKRTIFSLPAKERRRMATQSLSYYEMQRGSATLALPYQVSTAERSRCARWGTPIPSACNLHPSNMCAAQCAAAGSAPAICQ